VEVDIFIDKFEAEATQLEGRFLENTKETSNKNLDYGKLLIIRSCYISIGRP